MGGQTLIRRFPLGVRGKLLALVLVLLLPVVVLDGYGVYARYETRVDSELAESQALAEAVSSAMFNFLESLWSVELATGLAIAIDQGTHTTDDLNAYLEQQMQEPRTVNAFTWVGPDGTVLASTAPHMRGTSVADRDYFRRAVAGEQKIVSDVLMSRASHVPTVIVARRIEMDGRFYGVAVAGVNLAKLGTVLPLLPAEGRRYSFIDRTGVTVFRSDQPARTLSERLPHPSETATRALLGETVLIPSFTDPETGERRMGVAVPLPALGWAVTSSVPHNVIMSDIRSDTWRDLIVLFLVAAFSTLAALYFSRSIVRPVMALQKAARAISIGDLGARVAPTGRDEVAAAAQTFNSMASRVQSADEILKSRVTAVAHLSQQALTGAKTEHLANAAAGVVALSLGGEAAVVLEIHPNTETVHVLSAVGLSDYLRGRIVRTGYDYLATKVVTQTGPVVIDDLASLLGSKEAKLAGVRIRTAAAVTIHGYDAPFGVLAVGSTQDREYSQADLHFLQAVANVVSTAIQRNRSDFEQAFLARAGTMLANSLDIDAALVGMADLVTDHLADWCVVDLTLGGKHRRVVRSARADQAEIRQALERLSEETSSACRSIREWAYSGQPHIRRRVTDQVLREIAEGDQQLLALLRSLKMVSTIVVPLTTRGKTIGIISLMSCEAAGYDAHDLHLAVELAHRAAMAIDHADMYANLRLLAHQQAAIAELGQTLITGAGLATVLTEGVAMVERELGVKGCRILETQPDGDRLRIRTGPEWNGGVTIPVEVPPHGLTPMGYALRSGFPVIVPDVNQETRFAMPPEIRRPGIVSGACAVIPGAEEPYGVIAVYMETPRNFTSDEMNFLMAVANLMSQAVQHERDEQRLHTQHAVARILAEAGDAAETIPLLLRTLGEGLGWDVGFFWVMDQGSQTATIEQIWQMPGLENAAFVEACRGFTARKSEGVVGEAWREARPLWIPDLKRENRFLREKEAALADLHGAILIPIFVGDEVYAVIESFSREVRRPDPHVIRMATTIGRQVGQFLQRRRAEDDLRQLNARLEERVVARTAELQAVNKELESFAYSVSHDLRAPLRTIDGFSQMLAEDYGEQVGEDGRDYIKRIRAATKHMGGLIDDILRLSRLMRHELRPKRVNLSALARSIIATLETERPRTQPVSIIVEEGMSVVGDERLLRLALHNLLSNAWKFTSRTPQAEIHVGVQQQGGTNVFFVRDNGVGFDMAIIDRLFDPFQRFHSAKEFEGSGIGLTTVQRVVQRHGGRVWAEGKVGEGAVFYFTL